MKELMKAQREAARKKAQMQESVADVYDTHGGPFKQTDEIGSTYKDEYISYLMTVEELMFTDEIVCMDLFPGEDPREKIASAIRQH